MIYGVLLGPWVLLALVDRVHFYHQIGILSHINVQIDHNLGTEQNPVYYGNSYRNLVFH